MGWLYLIRAGNSSLTISKNVSTKQRGSHDASPYIAIIYKKKMFIINITKNIHPIVL